MAMYTQKGLMKLSKKELTKKVLDAQRVWASDQEKLKAANNRAQLAVNLKKALEAI